jgi:hypothetical protein
LEDWEKEARKHNDVVSGRKLLEKYKGLKFWDNDEHCYQTIDGDNLEWRTKTKEKIHTLGGIALLMMKRERVRLGIFVTVFVLIFRCVNNQKG